ncbi:MAG TPA: inositol phosphorylceramide synthase, partial [Acidimicrobium sp.]|nr:inositol phosphorylceramide synthase [Acidimicrobium sp.]
MSMQWVTWDQAMVTAIACLITVSALRRFTRNKFRSTIIAWCTELALISGLYTLWRLAMTLPLDHAPGAIERAHQINDLQQHFYLPTELSL